MKKADVRDLMILDTYHIINRYINQGASEDRHNLWLQGQKLRMHVLKNTDLTIEKPKFVPPTTDSATAKKSLK